MTYEEFKECVRTIDAKYLRLRKGEMDNLVKEYEKDLPFHVGDRIRFLVALGERKGVVENIRVLTVPVPHVSVKLKGRKTFYDINPEFITILK